MRSWILAACLCCATSPPAHAATLRAYRAVSGREVHLSDLWTGIESPDRVLGTAPAPGARMFVQAPQLAAIARDFGVDWRPVTGAEQTIIARASREFPPASLLALLRPRLAQAGAPADAELSLTGYVPPMLPQGAAPEAGLTNVTYDPATASFAATLTLAVPDAEPLVVGISGRAAQMTDVAILTRPHHAGDVLSADDVRLARRPLNALRREVLLAPGSVAGLALRRDIAGGQPLVAGDLANPILVARNASIRMALNAGAITLSAEGVALEQGALHAHIRVQNPTSRAVMLAEVTGADEVRIMAGHAPVAAAAP